MFLIRRVHLGCLVQEMVSFASRICLPFYLRASYDGDRRLDLYRPSASQSQNIFKWNEDDSREVGGKSAVILLGK